MTIRSVLISARIILTTAMAVFLSVPDVVAAEKSIILQSTTSTQNSGLFDFILPKFEKQTGIFVKVVAVGTGQALKNARNGDGDVVLVHAKSAEEKFVADGFGLMRYDVMYNDFIIIGPAADPAGLAGEADVLAALKMIAKTKSPFASRGDDSGTNKKEHHLWEMAGIDVLSQSGSWYRETGSGMGATLNLATGMGAYTLSDRATWIAFANKGAMKILSERDPKLFNQYGVMLVNPKKHPHIKEEYGKTFIRWITGPNGQAAIAQYRLEGMQLFFPNAK